MMSQVRLEKKNGVGHIIIDNPPLNVLSHDTYLQLDAVFKDLEQDSEVVVVLLSTVGDRAFAAGADIKEFPKMMDDPQIREAIMASHSVLNRIEQFKKPTVVVLDGLTLGGGCELALTFDIRVAEEHTRIGLPEVKLGLFPGGGGTQRLPRLIGAAKAKEMMFTGEPITAEEAHRIGLVNHVVSTGRGLKKGRELAQKIAQHSLQSLTRIKEAVDYGLSTSLYEGIEREADLFVEVFQTDDVREGVSAFLQRRQPIFSHS